ncbi:hypothetical protein P879_08195 [Paragonimus westermani]|uniref:Testis-expressed sequence 9 protein n=1 Tax=Paragonimus westermani TaxID=34504 RepID=A0A8T0D1P2_9TREM|nr:hypothetical protein P879_08195 [Paragonimus westermani]
MLRGTLQSNSSSASRDLQAKEEQYRVLNAQLEERTAQLLKEADKVLQNAQVLNEKNGESQGPNNDSSIEKNVHDEQIHYEDNGNFDEDILPAPANKLSQKAQNRYLRAKVRVLQEEIQKMSSQLNNYHDDNARLTKLVQELEEERNRLHRVTTSHSAQVDKVKKSLNEARTHCDVLEAERNTLRKEGENTKRTMNQQAAELKSTTTRLQRALEETERLKQEMDKTRSSTRESVDSMKHSIEQLMTDNRRLERQKTELITAFKKQLRLIDVLRRQKMLIEASKCLQLTEEEFLKALDWQTTPPS